MRRTGRCRATLYSSVSPNTTQKSTPSRAVQRRKVALAKVLASDFDVLILDEPTNHLDNAMLSWLEDYLKNYRGTVFMVTHDRYFLDKVSNRILEISHGKMYSYDSNYSRFLELKAEREEMELASERKRQSILRMELEWAKRGCRARSTKQRARLERLEVLKNGTAPTADAVVEMDAVETRMGKKTIEFHNVSKAFGDKTLMKDFEYIFLRNQSVGIIVLERLRKIHNAADDHRRSPAGCGNHRNRRHDPHRLSGTGRAGHGYESARDRLRERYR